MLGIFENKRRTLVAAAVVLGVIILAVVYFKGDDAHGFDVGRQAFMAW